MQPTTSPRIKDPTVVYYNGRWHVYATVFNITSTFYNMVYLNFTDFAQADSAPQYYMDQTPGLGYYHCAPQLFYFAPQKPLVSRLSITAPELLDHHRSGRPHVLDDAQDLHCHRARDRHPEQGVVAPGSTSG